MQRARFNSFRTNLIKGFVNKSLTTNQYSTEELDGDGDTGYEKKPRDEDHLQCALLQKTERGKN